MIDFHPPTKKSSAPICTKPTISFKGKECAFIFFTIFHHFWGKSSSSSGQKPAPSTTGTDGKSATSDLPTHPLFVVAASVVVAKAELRGRTCGALRCGPQTLKYLFFLRNLFICVCWGTWGLFQGSAGIFLDIYLAFIFAHICTLTYHIIPLYTTLYIQQKNIVCIYIYIHLCVNAKSIHESGTIWCHVSKCLFDSFVLSILFLVIPRPPVEIT